MGSGLLEVCSSGEELGIWTEFSHFYSEGRNTNFVQCYALSSCLTQNTTTCVRERHLVMPLEKIKAAYSKSHVTQDREWQKANI
jgi:hypothetical protein